MNLLSFFLILVGCALLHPGLLFIVLGLWLALACSGESETSVEDAAERFREEVLGEETGLTWDDIAKHDAQEMALFCFLRGAGVPWEKARDAENFDLVEEQHP
jgi:hypothetical protein